MPGHVLLPPCPYTHRRRNIFLRCGAGERAGVGLAVTVADVPAIVTVGDMMPSLAVIESVIVSPAFALALSSVLSDAIVTAVSVGTVRSSSTAVLSVTDVTDVPVLPAVS